MKRALTAVAATIIVASTAIASQPAKAQDSAAAFFAGAALGTVFPFVGGYSYHPSGHYYVRSPHYYTYPATHYRWDPYVGGYIYAGPRWQHWHGQRHVYHQPRRHYYGYNYPQVGLGFGWGW